MAEAGDLGGASCMGQKWHSWALRSCPRVTKAFAWVGVRVLLGVELCPQETESLKAHPSTYDCDLIWNRGLYRQIKMR